MPASYSPMLFQVFDLTTPHLRLEIARPNQIYPLFVVTYYPDTVGKPGRIMAGNRVCLLLDGWMLFIR